MLPIATVQGVKDGISTGMIVDLSEYLKKTEGVSKEEHAELESVVSTKLDAEPQHKHHIEDIKQLQNLLDGKYDKSEKYSYNVILSDSEKIPYLEAPKVLSMEIANKFVVEGYKFYVDDASGDLMIVFNDVLIGSYSKTGSKWTLNGLETGAAADHRHDEMYYSKEDVDTIISELDVNSVNLRYTLTPEIIPAFHGPVVEVSGKTCDISFEGQLKYEIKLGTIFKYKEKSTQKEHLFICTYIELSDSKESLKFTFENQAGSVFQGYQYLSDKHISTSTLYEIEIPDWETTGFFKINPVKNTDLLTLLILTINNMSQHINSNIAKITELEAVLQNHYQALMLLLEKHDLVDTNTNDGANITTGNN